MGVGARLGFALGLDSGFLRQAADEWSRWLEQEPDLLWPATLEALPDWLSRADPVEADRVLHALVRFGSPTGDCDRLATGVVAWVLVPGARRVAHRLRTLSPDIDGLVASQLWVEVRTFPWERLHRVAANVLANTRAAVLAECGVSAQLRRVDRTWAATVVQDPLSARWVRPGSVVGVEQPAEVELRTLLEDARELGLLDWKDHAILRGLVAHADRSVSTRTGRARAGLLADDVVAMVAGEVGVSPATVRRRTRRAVLALATARRSGLIEAA